MITREGWKLIQLKDDTFQPYHILEDPLEYQNIEKQHSELVQRMIPIFNEQLNSDRADLQSVVVPLKVISLLDQLDVTSH